MRPTPQYDHDAGVFTCDSSDAQDFASHLNRLGIQVHPPKEWLIHGDYSEMMLALRDPIREEQGSEAVSGFVSDQSLS